VIFDQAQRLYLNFNQALDFLKLGHRVTREGWNGKNQWIKAQFPDEHSKMQQPYLYICPVTGLLTPWVPSQGDLFASDWLLIIEPETPSAKLPTKVN
jgi:hypothetical protein